MIDGSIEQQRRYWQQTESTALAMWAGPMCVFLAPCLVAAYLICATQTAAAASSSG